MSIAILEAIHANPWADELIDLPSLNHRASTAVEQLVHKTRSIAREEPSALPSFSLAILGPAGAGKTHLFSRLRRRLGPRAVFTHVKPPVGTCMTPRTVLRHVADQLRMATQGLKQVDALVGSLLAFLDGEGERFPRAFLDELRHLDTGARASRLDQALERVLEIWPEVDDIYARRLIEAPFVPPPTQRALLAWLSGQECDASQLARIGAAASIDDDRIAPAFRTLSLLASVGAPIVVVFDQLENLVNAAGPTDQLNAYAQLATELIDGVRGLVVVQMALDTEFARFIEPSFNLAQRSRLAMQRETLALPTAEERHALLRLWLERLPSAGAPFPHPLTVEQLRALSDMTSATPRMLRVELRDVLQGKPLDVPSDAPQDSTKSPESATAVAGDRVQALEKAWNEHLERARAVLDDLGQRHLSVDDALLIDGFLAALGFVEGVRVEVHEHAAAKLVVERPSGPLAVALLSQAHFKSVAAALARLTQLAGERPVLALRERVRDLPPTWREALKRRDALLQAPHGRYELLDRDDVVRLLGIASLLAAARSRDVTDAKGGSVSEAEVRAWVARELAVAEWPIVRTLLQDTRTEGAPASAPLTAKSPAAVPPPPRSSRAAPGGGPALTILRRLRVASVERLVREVVRLDRGATRGSVLEELARSEGAVRWFGGTLLAIREEEQ